MSARQGYHLRRKKKEAIYAIRAVYCYVQNYSDGGCDNLLWAQTRRIGVGAEVSFGSQDTLGYGVELDPWPRLESETSVFGDAEGPKPPNIRTSAISTKHDAEFSCQFS
jgi:hypothetical protein